MKWKEDLQSGRQQADKVKLSLTIAQKWYNIKITHGDQEEKQN